MFSSSRKFFEVLGATEASFSSEKKSSHSFGKTQEREEERRGGVLEHWGWLRRCVVCVWNMQFSWTTSSSSTSSNLSKSSLVTPMTHIIIPSSVCWSVSRQKKKSEFEIWGNRTCAHLLLQLVLNEQFMISAHDPVDERAAYAPPTNKVIKVLSMHGSYYKTFGENIILLINREGKSSLHLSP